MFKKYTSGVIIATFLVLILLAVSYFTKASGAQPQTVKIYPPDNVSGQVSQYSETSTTCNFSIATGGCYDSDPGATWNVYQRETDGVMTFKQSGGAHWPAGNTQLCREMGVSAVNPFRSSRQTSIGVRLTPRVGVSAADCCSCQGPDWSTPDDTTINHDCIKTNNTYTYAQQSIKIPPNVNKITRVRFYEIYWVWEYSQPENTFANLQLEILDTNNQRLKQTPVQTGGDFTNLDTAVTPGSTYTIKLAKTDETNLSLPVSAPCGDNCKWYPRWCDSGPFCCDTVEWDSQKTHSDLDVYPDGYAQSPSAYFEVLSKVGGIPKADLARMAVWGEIPPAPDPPTITSLQVGNANPGQTTFSGTYGITSNQSAQGGKDWLNPLRITLNASQGTNPIKSYYVAFYDKGALDTPPAFRSIIDPTTSEPITQLKRLLKADYNAGFLLRYDATGKYYLWDPSIRPNPGWRDISGFRTLGWRICGNAGCDTQLFYTAYPVNSTPTWKVLFDKNFGSKTMYTAVYVLDTNNLSSFQANITPENY